MSFEKQPSVRVKGEHCSSGWDAVLEDIKNTIAGIDKPKKVIVLEMYHGTMMEAIQKAFLDALAPELFIDTADCFRTEKEIIELTYPDVTDDRIFGKITNLSMDDFMDVSKVMTAHEKISDVGSGTILIAGYGATLIHENPDLLVYADMARWEIQLRMRANQVSNLGVTNPTDPFETKYKRGFFVDWRVCDRLKIGLLHKIDFLLDTNNQRRPKLISGDAFRKGLEISSSRPFSLVPFFDPGPWGGQWMREHCDLDHSAQNFAWCFNCVPEENSLLLEFDDDTVEVPAIDLVFYRPIEFMGQALYDRFGAEFPIRFDFLDTVEGGNLSLQVHPSDAYIQENFNMGYTQDESYYMLDAKPGAEVYLGMKKGVDPKEMFSELREAANGKKPFDAEKYTAKWPARKHDHFLIPAGTIHCSGKDCMVLEISATPYIFTFKLWDWGRLGMDGRPRPINIGHGEKVMEWDRTEDWVEKNLINCFETLSKNGVVKEERTGLHEFEFIETRRHWFSGKITHEANGSVHVFNLVEGEEAVVESTEGSFEPFVVHYAETFVVPAAVESYTIRPHGKSEGKEIATIKAYVRLDHPVKNY